MPSLATSAQTAEGQVRAFRVEYDDKTDTTKVTLNKTGAAQKVRVNREL